MEPGLEAGPPPDQPSPQVWPHEPQAVSKMQGQAVTSTPAFAPCLRAATELLAALPTFAHFLHMACFATVYALYSVYRWEAPNRCAHFDSPVPGWAEICVTGQGWQAGFCREMVRQVKLSTKKEIYA
jgi:hypothetical protein